VAEPVCPTDSDDLCHFVDRWTHVAWLARASHWLIAKPLSILALVLFAVVLRWVIHRAIDRLARSAAEGALPAIMARGKVPQFLADYQAAAAERREQRAATMGGLLKSITTAVIACVVGFMVVAQLGYNIAPLIASAGIIGVALGFGAQSLVKDFLSGIFIILEDQYGVGDVITLPTTAGVIEAVGLRVTRLRDVDGTVWYVRNGEILAVGNMSQNWSRSVLDIPVAPQQNLGRIRDLLREEAQAVYQDPAYRDDILEEPDVWGVERWDSAGIIMRLVVKTAPQRQWSVSRELRERIKDRFDAEGIS